MWRSVKVLLATFLSAGFLLSGSTYVKAAVQIPEKVRIGLYYKTTAVSSFDVSAEKGLQVGFVKDDSFNVLFEEHTNNNLKIRKDTYLVNNNGKLAEYNPSSSVPAGERIGPYHVRIGGVYKDLAAASQQVALIRQKGIAAYPAYVDSWQVWTGFYTDQNAAQADLTSSLQKKLGNVAFEVVQPSQNRMAVLTANGNVGVLFGSDTSRFQIRPKTENTFYALTVNGTPKYRGELEVRRLSGSDMTVINIVPFEEYLYGVVPSEMESYSHQEALKAQAVAARTYALNSIGQHKDNDFDLCATTHCQVYKGLSGEAQTTNKAVDGTNGRIVTYNGKIAAVFFFSSSGGRTEDSKNVWGYEYPYLKSVEDKYESGKSYNYTWEKSYTADQIKEIMLSRGYDLGNIIDMSVTKRSEAGRATEFIIKGTKDQRVYVNSKCREVFSLPSQWYTVTTDSSVAITGNVSTASALLGGKKVLTAEGIKTLSSSKTTVIGAGGQKELVSFTVKTYKFSGRGWGHGLGMSQEGAKGMAQNGYTYEQILTHYFKGTKVE